MNRLTVLYQGWGQRWPLGTLAHAGDKTVFEYSPEALRQGLELSPYRLALRQQAYTGAPALYAGLPGLIADALPDGWGLMLMDRAFRKAGRDPATISPLDRLAFIGERAIGALSFEPATGPSLDAQDISLLELAQKIERLTAAASATVLNQLVLIGGSPHGARPKALVNYERSSGRMSAGGTPGDTGGGTAAADAPGEPWLIKFPARGEHAEVCAIEELYAGLARACGLDMPTSAWFPLSRNLAAFGVKRFDRDNGMRVPVHTLAGALHTDYRVPSVDAIDFLRLTRLMTSDMREVHKAFERCVFNLIFNNRDDHAKNFSYRLNNARHWQLSPAYDLTFNSGPGGHHQLAYAGETLAPGRASLLQVAAKGGIDESAALQSIKRMLAVARNMARHAEALPVRKATLRAVVQAVEANSMRLKG